MRRRTIERDLRVALAAGEPSQLFFLHLNALLSSHQRQAQSTVRPHPSGGYESITAGTYTIGTDDYNIEWCVKTSTSGQVEGLVVASGDNEAEPVIRFAEEMVRAALANALSNKMEEFFHRRVLSYVGPALSGEYWLPKLRFAPAAPEEDRNTLHRMDCERAVVLDFHVAAIDSHHSELLASDLESSYAQRLSLFLDTNLRRIPHEWIWVVPDVFDGHNRDSTRLMRGFRQASSGALRMPAKGEMSRLGEFEGSLSDAFRSHSANLMTLPKEARALFRIASRAPAPEALAFEACARMYRLSLALRPYSHSASLAYRVAAIDSIVSATRSFGSVSDFIRHYCPDIAGRDELLELIYGSVRSGHFHSGAVPLDNTHGIPFHPLMNPTETMMEVIGFEADIVARRALGGWLRDIAQREQVVADESV